MKSKFFIANFRLMLALLILPLVVAAKTPEGKYVTLDTETESHPPGRVEMMLFIDFFCPHCHHFEQEILPALRKKYGEKLAIRTVGLPVVRKESEELILIYLTVRSLGKGEAFKDLLFKTIHDPSAKGKEIRVADLIESIGLDPKGVMKVLESGLPKKEAEEGLALGKRVGVRGTPAMLINGKYRVDEPSLQNLTKIIDSLVK